MYKSEFTTLIENCTQKTTLYPKVEIYKEILKTLNSDPDYIIDFFQTIRKRLQINHQRIQNMSLELIEFISVTFVNKKLVKELSRKNFQKILLEIYQNSYIDKMKKKILYLLGFWKKNFENLNLGFFEENGLDFSGEIKTSQYFEYKIDHRELEAGNDFQKNENFNPFERKIKNDLVIIENLILKLEEGNLDSQKQYQIHKVLKVAKNKLKNLLDQKRKFSLSFQDYLIRFDNKIDHTLKNKNNFIENERKNQNQDVNLIDPFSNVNSNNNNNPFEDNNFENNNNFIDDFQNNKKSSENNNRNYNKKSNDFISNQDNNNFNKNSNNNFEKKNGDFFSNKKSPFDDMEDNFSTPFDNKKSYENNNVIKFKKKNMKNDNQTFDFENFTLRDKKKIRIITKKILQ